MATIASTNAAFADITATEAWENWHNQLITSGYDINFDLANAGDILTINNLTLSKDMDEGPEKTVIGLGAVSYMERGDGTVEMVFANESALTWQTESGTYLVFERQHQNMHYILSGTPDSIKHDITADKLAFILTEMKRNGQTVNHAKVSLRATDISSQYQISGDALQKGDISFSFSKLSYDIKIETPEPIYKMMDLSGVISGLNMNLDVAIPKNFENKSFSETINAGFAINSDFGFDQIQNTFVSIDGSEKSNGSLLSNGGMLSFHMIPKTSDLVNIKAKIVLPNLDVDMDINMPERDTDVSLKLLAGGFDFNLGVLLPKNADPDKPHQAFNDGMDIRYDHKITGYSIFLKTKEDGRSVTVDSAVEAADISLTANRKELQIKGQSQGAKTTVDAEVMPIGPLEYSFGKTAIDLQIPMGVSAAPEPFSLKMMLSDVVASETIWALFDKQALISRDAASFSLELSGAANWLVDIMDPETKDTERKGELHSLNLKTLAIMAAGAKLTGNADFSFDNNDLETFGGLPAPSGNAHFDTSGVNALIDTMIKLGIMSSDDAMDARMGLSMIAIAGQQDDTLVSDIVVTPGGQITANGKQIK